MVSLYNILTDTPPPRARPGPPRPSSASGGPPAAARCGGVTNPTAEHRDAVGRSEVQLGVCIAHPGLPPGPINRRLRRRGQKLLLPPVHTFIVDSSTDLADVLGFNFTDVAPAEGLPGAHHAVRARYSDFAICSCGGISQICQWYRVCDAGALRAEPLATLLSCAVIIPSSARCARLRRRVRCASSQMASALR